jgi:coenzyme F420-reducing hydrogenase delta subunit
MVLEALSLGFDGVMAVICPEELCKLEEGTYLGERNFSALKVVLKQYNLQDRFDSFRVSPKYPGEFKTKLAEFKKKISSIPETEEKTS